MPRTRDGLGSGHNCALFCDVVAPLAIGEYLTIKLSDYVLSTETLRAYVEQAARLLSITLRTRKQGDVIFVGRFRNPQVNDMGISHAEARERVKQIRKLAGTMSNWEIADILGLHPTNLAYIAQKNKISLNYFRRGPRWTTDRDEALIGYVLQGKKPAQIAKLMGVSLGSVEHRCTFLRSQGCEVPMAEKGGHRHGVEWSQEKSDLLVSLWGDGLHWQEILDQLGEGFTKNSIYWHIKVLRAAGVDVPRRAKDRR